MNHRSLISLLLLLSTALALLNYYTSFGLTNVNVGDAEAHSFSPPQTEFRVKAPTRRNNSTSNTSLFNFTLKTINPQISGRLAPQRRTGIAFSSPTKHKNNGDHWWSYTDSCFAVDDICRIPDNRWFYFQHNSATTNQSNDIAALKWQPSFELKYMPHTYQRGVYADTRVQMNVHASHRIAWDELEQTNQCRVSTDPYHVILQSLFNVSFWLDLVRSGYFFPDAMLSIEQYSVSLFLFPGHGRRILQPNINVHVPTALCGPIPQSSFRKYEHDIVEL